MNPQVSQKNISDLDLLTFTVSGINVSFANAVRRVLLSEIPTVVCRTETYQDNHCRIYTNTTRLHNEILKQRLSCIPIHATDLHQLPGIYQLVIDVKNDTPELMWVTTEHFKVQHKETKEFMSRNDVQTLFPSNPLTGTYIDFARLRPALSESIPGEAIHLTCEFSIATAKENSMFNVVSKSTYGNSIDKTTVDAAWKILESKYKEKGDMEATEIEFERRNFYLLDAQRYAIENSFDFAVQSVGVFTSNDLVVQALMVLQKKMSYFEEQIQAKTIRVIPSDSVSEYSVMENSWDVILEGEDYTLGKVLEFVLYELYYLPKDPMLSFCGFKKFHPHNTASHIRIAFRETVEEKQVRELMVVVAQKASQVFRQWKQEFEERRRSFSAENKKTTSSTSSS